MMRFAYNTAVLLILLVVIGFQLPGGAALAESSAEPFPLYPCIKPNVSFWKKVYSQYSSTQGLVHDSRNLDIIYEVIELASNDIVANRKRNESHIDRVTSKYEKVLRKLATGEAPASELERRVHGLFGPRPDRADFAEAAGSIRLQRGLKDRFKEGVIRSGAYLTEIKKIFRSHGLPEDLAYLPHVESSFEIGAFSKSGAAGIWQFTSGTGRRFLNIDYTVDERRDPILSSYAAAAYLKENYDLLGSWPLALTAYNHGANGIKNAQETCGDYEQIFRSYNGRRFKFASRNFYSEFLAALDVAKNYERHFGPLTLDPPLASRLVSLPGYAAVADLCRHFEVSRDTLRQLNPALRPPVFEGNKFVPKSYALRLPLPAGRDRSLQLAAVPEQILHPKQKPSRLHRVERGDTASGVARRHGVSLAALRSANNLDRKASIYVGQNLLIPAAEEVEITLSRISKTAAPAAKVQPESPAPPETAKAAEMGEEATRSPEAVVGNLAVARVVEKDGRKFGLIRVEADETLGLFAKWSESPVVELLKLNGIGSRKEIGLNEQIKVPLARVSKEELELRRFEFHKQLQEDFFASFRVEQIREYSVKTGDTIWHLCREKFDVPIWLMRKYNAEVDLLNLKPSQKIMIPVTVRQT